MAETEEDFVEIVDNEVLDIKKYTNLVSSSSAGAIATFIGTTRDNFEGKQVLELRYEAYVPMALKQMRAICASARDQYKPLRLVVAHRLGVVPVGEESVFVAVSSIHRRDSFEACEYVIDEIKASVPIWKKEVYANGEVWKENSKFFLRKAENNVKELNSKEHKSHNQSMCCGLKEKVPNEGKDNHGNVGEEFGQIGAIESEGLFSQG